MSDYKRLSPNLAVAGQIQPGQLEAIARQGFHTCLVLIGSSRIQGGLSTLILVTNTTNIILLVLLFFVHSYRIIVFQQECNHFDVSRPRCKLQGRHVLSIGNPDR